MRNNIFSNIPNIKQREFKFRNKISSHELNKLQKETFEDILDLFNKANTLQKVIYEMQETNNIESFYYATLLEHLKQKIQKLEEDKIEIDGYRYVSCYPQDAETYDDVFGATLDKVNNDITAHIVNSENKIRVYDETFGEYMVPSSLQVFIGPDDFKTNPNVYAVEDSDIKNAFDGDIGTVWFRKIITSTDVNEIVNELVIGLPEEILTTRLINQISLTTFPSEYIDIMSVKYKHKGNWEEIPLFKAHQLCTEQTGQDAFGNTYQYHAINNASSVKFNFQAIHTSQLKITLRQRTYNTDTENNRRIWHLGLRNVNVCFNTYTKEHSVFDCTYDFKEKDKTIVVHDAEIIYNNKGITNDNDIGVSKEYFYFGNDNLPHKISGTAPFVLDGHKLMVRYTILGDNNITPNIYNTRIKYKLTTP